MINNMNSLRNKVIKEVKEDIKEINVSIDKNLLIILDNYQTAIIAADEFYLKLCDLNKNLLLEKSKFINSNFYSKNELDGFFEEAKLIIKDLEKFKKDVLEKDILNKKLRKVLIDDLSKIKVIELTLKKFDTKTGLLCGSMNLLNIFKKIEDFCNFILKDFNENYEEKIYNLYEHIIENIQSYAILCSEYEDEYDDEASNASFSTFNISKIPTIYKNKRFNSKDLSKIALENNFILSRHNGDHDIFKHKDSNKIVVIPYKGSTTLAPKTQQSILNMIFA